MSLGAQPEWFTITDIEYGMNFVLWAIRRQKRGVRVYKLENPYNKKEFTYGAGRVNDILDACEH